MLEKVVMRRFSVQKCNNEIYNSGVRLQGRGECQHQGVGGNASLLNLNLLPLVIKNWASAPLILARFKHPLSKTKL